MNAKSVVFLIKILYFGIPIKLCQMVRCGVPKEPSIMHMDWKALGYERVYIDGRLRWVHQDAKNKNTSS